MGDVSPIENDLRCWGCRYNLRMQPGDGRCPECAFSVAESVRLRSQQRRAFTFDVLPWWVRTCYVVFGVVLPIMAFGIYELGGGHTMVTWQSGEWYDIPAMLLAGVAARPFYPLLIFASVCLMLLVGDPDRYGRQRFVAIGCFLGFLLGLQYAIIMLPASLVQSGGSYRTVDSFAFGGIMLTGGFIAANGLRMLAAWLWPDDKFPGRFKLVETFSAIGAMIVVVVSLIIFPLGMLFSPVMYGLAFGSALTRFIVTESYDRKERRPRPAQRGALWTAIGVALAYIVAWPSAVMLAFHAYHKLPTQPPSGCYICTAAAKGHPWLVRSVPVVLGDGTVMRVNRQMRVLKAAEWVLAERLPWAHRLLRRVYDFVGPALASRVRSPWAADLAWLLFAVPALLAWVGFWLSGRMMRVHRTYR